MTCTLDERIGESSSRRQWRQESLPRYRYHPCNYTQISRVSRISDCRRWLTYQLSESQRELRFCWLLQETSSSRGEGNCCCHVQSTPVCSRSLQSAVYSLQSVCSSWVQFTIPNSEFNLIITEVFLLSSRSSEHFAGDLHICIIVVNLQRDIIFFANFADWE